MKRIFTHLFLGVIALGVVGNAFIFSEVRAASDLFPVYPCIRPNVEFWKKVYAQYTSEQGIIHDKLKLQIIYGVIDLEDWERPRAKKTNNSRIKNVKKKYKKILEKLIRKGHPLSQEEKRVAALFGPGASRSDFQKAVRNIRCQTGQKDRFRQGIIRSGAYLNEIKGIMSSYGLPVDLANMPHVESSFNPKACSKFGAAGIWQFTRSTGKRFMTVSYTVDERWDPIRSSYAAARLLKENYEKLGNWPLAITAYNHGAAGMLRAKNRKGDYEKIFKEYRSRSFRFASQNFYPEFLAAREVVENYQRYFGELKLDKPRKILKVVLDGYVSMGDLSDFLKVDINTIRDLNPSLRKPVYNGQKYVPKGYALRLPLDHGRPSLNLSSGLPREMIKPHQKRSRFYMVQRGDTAGRVARRHRIKLSKLVLANNLDSRATIFAGQNLRIPVPSQNHRIAMDSSPKGTQKKQITSRHRDASEKRLDSKPGLSISFRPLPSSSQASPPTPESPVNPAVVTGNLLVEKVIAQHGKRIGIVRVQTEETLGHYADWLGLATQEIRRLNRFRYGKTLRTREKVKIPLDKVTKDQFEEKRFEYHKGIEEDFFGSYDIETVQTYRIKNGDNIWTLCYDVFKVPLWLVSKYNLDLDFNQLMPGQKLFIPLLRKIG